MSTDITGFIAWLRGWFDDIYSQTNHTHTYDSLINKPNISVDGSGVIETWNSPTYNSTYVNSNSSHVNINKIGNIAIVDYYFNLSSIPSSDTIVVNNIPEDFQPQTRFNEITTGYNGVIYLLTMLDSKIYLKHYGSGNGTGQISGMITYVVKNIVKEVTSVELETYG